MRFHRLCLAAVAATAIALAGFATGAAHANPGNISLEGVNFAPAPTGIDQFDTVIDAEDFEDLAAITDRIDPHLYVDDAGLVQLADVSAEELGVTEEFLADFQLALSYSNELIANGEIVVAEDMTVSPGETFERQPGSAGLDAVSEGESLDGAAPQGAVPDWSAYGYSSGAMYYNSYGTYQRYRSNYYGLCSAMAAYLRYPHFSQNLNYFYTYNNYYINNSCYNSYGVYYYLPYQQGCQYRSGSSYSPCYGNLGYKPAYYWQQSYGYNAQCRCYQYNWQWQGYWSRY